MARCNFTWVAGPVKSDSVLGLGRLWFEYCTLEDGPVMGQLLVAELFFVHSVILEWPVQSGLSGQTPLQLFSLRQEQRLISWSN